MLYLVLARIKISTWNIIFRVLKTEIELRTRNLMFLRRSVERVILIILSVKKINGDKKAARHGGIDGSGKGCVCNLTNSHARTTPLWPKLNASSQADIRMDCRKIDEIHQSPQKRC